MDYEKYRYLCDNFTDQESGNKLPLRLTKAEEQEAMSAFNSLHPES